MAINKKLITFDKKAAFLGANGINGSTSPTDGYFGQIPAWSMVFIKDTGEIWHLGVYFGKPISSLISSGGSYTNGFVYTPDGTNYYYKTVTLWGNTLNGSTVNLKDKLVTEETISGTTYRLAYGGRGIERRTMSGSTPVDTYLMMFGENLVTIDAITKVRGGLLTVSSSNSYTASINSGIQTAGAIKADLYLYDTNTYISTNYSLGKAWNSIKLFNANGTQIDLSQTKPAIITIQESNHAVNSDWQPWISGGDMTSYSSWGIGLGGDAFYIGRISKDETTNLLTLYWKFNATSGITLSGTTKYILVDGIQDGNNKVFMADGTLKSLSEAMGVSIGEATINDLGGFKLSTAKATTTLTMTSSTTGAGKYPIKMNADSTLYVEITQANTWKAANNSQEGYVPLLSNGGTALADPTNDYILAFTHASSGTLTPSWKKLPTTAYNNTTYKLKINNSTNGDSTNGVNLGTIYAPETAGTGFLKGTAGENGAITWSWDNSTYNNYSLPTASDLLKGGVKTGAAIDSVSGYTAVHIKDEVIYYKDTNTWKAANTSQEGYVPKLLLNSTNTISTLSSEYVLTYISGTETAPVWRKLPANAFNNTWTQFVGASNSSNGTAGYLAAPGTSNRNNFLRGDGTWQPISQNVTSALYVGASNGTSTSALDTNGNVYLIFKEGTSYSRYKLVGSGRASVTSDSNGHITINSSGYSNFTAATALTAGSAGLVPGPAANKLGSGGYFLRADGSWEVPTNTWKAANTSLEGYVPKLVTGGGTIASSDTAYVLAYKSGVAGTTTPVWILLPTNAYKNDNTWNAFTAATASAAGTAGYIQAPAGAQTKFFRGDNTWQDVLMLSGGTMTGTVTFNVGADGYSDSYTSKGIHMGNSNITGVNSIYTADVSENASEGFHFYRDSTHVDTIYAAGGVLYFVPNRQLGSAGTAKTVAHSGNITNNATTIGTSLTTIATIAGVDITAKIDSITASSLETLGTVSGTTHAVALQTEFTNNKANIPRNKLINYYSSAYGNGSNCFGYFLNGYDSNPYGGFFVAHYNNCYYVGIQNGTFEQLTIATSSNVSNKNATIGTSLTEIATVAGVSIKAKIGSYAASDHTHSVSINGSTKTITAPGGTAVDLGNYLTNYRKNTSISSTEVVNTQDYLHDVGETGGACTTMIKPTGMDNAWGILHLHLHTGNYAMQLGFGGTTGKMYFRNAYNTSTFGSWITLLDSNNWTGIIDGRYLPLSAESGSPLTGNLYFNSAGKGVFFKDSASKNYAAIYENGTNLWIGSTETSGTHHTGSTYISAGSGDVHISRLVNGTRTNYKILDAGNTYVSSGTGYINGSLITTISGNAGTATYAKWLMNRGSTTSGSEVVIGDSGWTVQKTLDGCTNLDVVWSLSWTKKGLTYTPSGGSATSSTDSGNIVMWLSKGNTSNDQRLNIQIDGMFYAPNGFYGNLTGHASQDLPLSGGTLEGPLYIKLNNTATNYKLAFTVDGEGGNITIYSPNSYKMTKSTSTIRYYLIDAYNGNLRVFTETDGSSWASLNTSGSLSTSALGTLWGSSTFNPNDYLAKSGGTMTGNIGIPVGRSDIDNSVPASGSSLASEHSSLATFRTALNATKSYIGSTNGWNGWLNVISCRHRNGNNDGNQYGMYIRTSLTASSDNLVWDREYSGSWLGERTILDSSNYSSYISSLSVESITVTDKSTHASSAQSFYIPMISTYSGNASFYGSTDFFMYRNSNGNYLNIGRSGITSGITFHNASESSGAYGDLVTAACTAYRSWTLPNASGTIALTSDLSSYLPLSGGTMSGTIILKGSTTNDMTYAGNVHPALRFDNADSSQNVSLVFTDYDNYRSPAGIKLVGNQGSEWFEAPNIYLNGTKVSVEGHTHTEYASLRSYTTDITSNSDLNNITDWGTYTCLAGSIASTLSHTPYTSGNFRLYNMVNTTGSNNMWWGAQILMANNLPRLFMRSHSENAFGDWVTILDSSNYTDYVYSKTNSDSRYVNVTGDSMSGSLTMTGNAELAMKMNVDTSNAKALYWLNTSGTIIGCVMYHNTAQGLILNPIGANSVWSDAVGKYSLYVGNNKLTYNTYNIYHEGNLTPLKHISVNSTTINNTAGSFAFEGSGSPWDGYDWVGFQVGSSNDKWLLCVIGDLIWRQNDSGGTNTSWGAWRTLLDSTNSGIVDGHKVKFTTSSIEVPVTYYIPCPGSFTNGYWHKLGDYVTAGDSSSIVLTLYDGPGYNSQAEQNSIVRITIKDGWQSSKSATNSVGTTIERFGIYFALECRIVATAHNAGAVWIYFPWQYVSGCYTVGGMYTSWTHNSATTTDTTTAPTTNQIANSSNNHSYIYLDNVYKTDLTTNANKMVNPGTASSFANLDISKTFIYISGNIGGYSAANRTISVSGAMVVGQVLTVLAYNSGSSTTLTTSYNSLDGTTIACVGSKFLEISILCYASGSYLVSCKSQ